MTMKKMEYTEKEKQRVKIKRRTREKTWQKKKESFSTIASNRIAYHDGLTLQLILRVMDVGWSVSCVNEVSGCHSWLLDDFIKYLISF